MRHYRPRRAWLSWTKKLKQKQLVKQTKHDLRRVGRKVLKVATKVCVKAHRAAPFAIPDFAGTDAEETMLVEESFKELFLSSHSHPSTCDSDQHDQYFLESSTRTSAELHPTYPLKPLLDALWALPRDTMSILQFHVLRPSCKYSSCENLALSREEWIENRLRLFRQMDLFASLAGGFGAAVVEVVTKNPQSLATLCIPHARIFGTAHVLDHVRFFASKQPSYVVLQDLGSIEKAMSKILAKFFTNVNVHLLAIGKVLCSGSLSVLGEMYKTIFVPGYMYNVYIKLIKHCFMTMKTIAQNREGWTLMAYRKMLVATHTKKKMKSIR